MKTRIKNLLPLLLLLGLPGVVQAQDAYSTNADSSIYTYSTNADGSANIVAYAGPPWVVTIPTNINGLTVTSIGSEAFENNTSLTSVTLSDSVTNIGEQAFVADYSLIAITVDTNNPAFSSLNGVLFDKSQTTLIEYPGGLVGSYTISNSIINIGADAFLLCSNLTSVTIGTNVTSIGDYAFDNCPSLTGVTIPDSVTSIGEGAFQGTALTSVTIPASVTNIGEAPFESCSSLTAITVDTNNPAFSSLNGVLFDKSHTTLIEYPGGLGGSYTISNSVTNIGQFAFQATALTSVTIPGSVTSIGTDAFLFTSLTNATIGNGVNSIGEEAFAFTSLTSITIPNSVTNIGELAFVYDYSLIRVTIGNGVSSIGWEAFDDGGETDDSLTSVYFMANAPAVDSSFRSDYNATAYYLPGTTGWSHQFLLALGLPTAPWFLPNPVILNNSASFGVQPGGFGFTISWATNASVVVVAATNLANPVWITVSTNTLTGGTNYFSDPQWTNYHTRFYRLRSP